MKVNTKDMRSRILDWVKKSPKAASDDKLLISLIWIDEGWDYNESLFDNLQRVSSPETIRRTRQKLQQDGLIKASEPTIEARYQDFKQARMSIF
ncbi:MAG: hypothetical protein K6G49_02155 [Candidatus Saccharibacteria bacterium]|nr:hypothetical protein [Candidatus Saccharibacteria bacterium]